MKDGNGGGSVEKGLSEHHKINSNPGANGMDTMGGDQKPKPNPGTNVSSKGKDFEIK